jgi:selenocysteine lyase/cysteine desulfurase
MAVSRRGFLARGGVALAATLAPGRLLAALEKSAPAPEPLTRWSDVRAQFALAPGYLHFSSFFLASHPKPVRAAIDGFRKALDENPFLTVEHGLFGPEASNPEVLVVEEAARYLGASSGEVALVPNTTTGLALVYQGLPLRAGEEVLTTAHDHYVHHESIRLATERAAAIWRRIPLFEHSAKATVSEIVGRVRGGIGP